MAKHKYTTLITGATDPIGIELANVFAKNSHNLVLVAKNSDKLKIMSEHLQQNNTITVHIVPIDLSQKEAPEELYQFIERSNFSIDHLVNNAAHGIQEKLDDFDLQEEIGMVQLNIIAMTHLTKLFVKDMVKRQSGRIMNVVSTAAFNHKSLATTYLACKAYTLFFSEALASELRKTGVTVTAFCPNPKATDMNKSLNILDMPIMSKTGLLINVEQSAKIGYEGFMKGKTVVTPGFVNKLIAKTPRLIPRKISRNLINFLHEV